MTKAMTDSGPHTWYRDGLPTLSCGPIELREVQPEDAPALHQLFARPEVSVHLSPPPSTIDAFLDWIHLFRAKRVEGQATCYALREAAGDPVGIFMSYRPNATDSTAEIGFATSPHLWGTGVFCPTALVYIDFLLDRWNVRTLTGRTLVRNHRALGAMRKLGAIIVGHTLRDGKPELIWTIKREQVYASRR